jgi:hypothetical protein
VRAQRDACESDPKFATRIKPRLEKIDKALDQMLVAIDKIGDNLEPKQGLAQVQSALVRAPQLEAEIGKVTSGMGDVTVSESK